MTAELVEQVEQTVFAVEEQVPQTQANIVVYAVAVVAVKHCDIV